MPILLSEYLQSVVEPSQQAEIETVILQLIADLSTEPPLCLDTAASEHFYSPYLEMIDREAATRVLLAKKSILDKLFNRTLEMLPCCKQEIAACSSANPQMFASKELNKAMQDAQAKFFLLRHAVLFHAFKIGNCSDRAAFAAIALARLFQGTSVKIVLNSLAKRDQFIVFIGNKTLGWKVYDPLTNPTLVFDDKEYTRGIVPYFPEYGLPKMPYKLTITDKHVEAFDQALPGALDYITTLLGQTTAASLKADINFQCHLATRTISDVELAQALRQLTDSMLVQPLQETCKRPMC